MCVLAQVILENAKALRRAGVACSSKVAGDESSSNVAGEESSSKVAGNESSSKVAGEDFLRISMASSSISRPVYFRDDPHKSLKYMGFATH